MYTNISSFINLKEKQIKIVKKFVFLTNLLYSASMLPYFYFKRLIFILIIANLSMLIN